MFCEYRNILGKPGEGVHAYRLWLGHYNFAIVDVVLTFLGARMITYFTNWPYYYTLPSLFLAGIVLHRLFCVDTALNRILF